MLVADVLAGVVFLVSVCLSSVAVASVTVLDWPAQTFTMNFESEALTAPKTVSASKDV